MTIVSGRARLSVAAAAAVLAALIVTFQWVQASHSRTAALDHAARETELMAHMLAEHSRHSIRLVDLVLDRAVRDADQAGGPDAAFSAGFQALVAPLDFIRNVMVLDRDGRVLRAMQQDQAAADRASARQVMTRPQSDAIVGLPAATDHGPVPAVMVGRGLDFGAGAAATLDAGYFLACCTLADRETPPGDSVVDAIRLTLAAADGTDLLSPSRHVPDHPDDNQLSSTAPVGDLPILAVATIDRDTALASWRLDTMTGCIRTVLLVLIIAGLAMVGIRLMRRQAADERRQDEQEAALKATAERFRLLFECTPTIAVQGYDDDRRVVFWNAASEALYGYPREQALGARFEDLIVPPAQRARAVREATDWRNGGQDPAPGERTRRRRDGTPVPVFSSHTRLTTPNGGQEFYCIDIDLTEIKRTQDALRESERRFHDYAAASSDWFWEMGPDLRFTSFSERMIDTDLEPQHLLGLTRPEVAGQSPNTPFWRSHQELLDLHLPFRDFTYPVAVGGAADDRKDGTERYIKASGKPIFDAEGCFLGYRGTASDVTAQVKAEELLRKLSEAVEQSPAAIAIVNASGLIDYVNRRFSQITGYGRDEVAGRPLSILHPDAEVGTGPWQLPGDGGEWRGEWRNRRKDGSLYWELATVSPITAADGSVGHYLVIGEDLSERKVFEERLLDQANYDALTGLPNRLLLFDRLTQALARSRREHRLLALLFVDLDHFKVINEVLGHDGGDRLLVEAARRLVGTVSESDTVARFGSDEFVIILCDVAVGAYADAAAHRILSAFSRPFDLGDREFVVTASIGMTIAPTDGDEPQALLRNADAAVRQAKMVGRNTYRFFTQEMNRKVGERLTLEAHLRHAVARNELSLVYQPIVELRTGITVGAEALLRWHNPDLGQVPPDHFIPVAEDTGLIIEIGEWVLHQACLEAGRWAAIAGRPIGLAVNISACQFRRLELIRTVTEALTAAGLPADRLELEITERLLVENAATTMVMLEELHEMGIRISIDDFGTGYSSLSYLKHLPVQTLKIDRSFVKDVPTGPRDSALTAAIVALAHNLDLQVIGEGVETQAQLDFLGTQGCDFIQGYFLSRPLPAPAFRAFLERK
jgi:diguanylate cyclase (GGDEF)-like protein/PAS domain S-box-containing protein